MGQQALLLIVLGVIVVGIAVVIGINVIGEAEMNDDRNMVTSNLTTFAAMAQQYYRKPIALGGGGKSFMNWEIPSSLDTTAVGTYKIKFLQKDTLILQGIGHEMGNNAKTPVKVEIIILKNSIKILTLN